MEMKKTIYTAPFCEEIKLSHEGMLCASTNPIDDAGEVGLNSFEEIIDIESIGTLF